MTERVASGGSRKRKSQRPFGAAWRKSSMSTLLDYLNPALKRMPTAGSGSLD